MKNKFKYFIIVIFMIFLLTGCENNINKETYSITYYINDQIIDLKPNTYEKGTSIILPTPVYDDASFIGWYDNKNYLGNKIEKISTTDTGNKAFYGLTASDDNEVIDIFLEPNVIEVSLGTSLDEVYSLINVFVKYNDETTNLLNIFEYKKNTNYISDQVGEYQITFTYNNMSKNAIVKVYEDNKTYIKPNIKASELKEKAKSFDLTGGLPSIGEPKVLVIPVEFTDYPATDTMQKDLEIAFFGTSMQTGWESLYSYYYKSSYGKLSITGTVTEPFNTGKASIDYKSDDFDYEILKAALEYYDTQINYDEYDTDKDGYIDSIYLIYTKEYDLTGKTNWWAYTYQYFTETNEYYDNVEADFYSIMSYQFLFDDLQDKKVKYNCETIIHETGHLLGLDDYYDYEENNGPNGGIGGGDMMDYNVGDHNAYSKALLGWINPYLLTGKTITIDLNGFASSGDAIMICKNWNGTFYDEYFIIDFYTPTGVNEMVKGNSGLFSISGIRIYHINATLNTYENATSIWEMTKYNNSNSLRRLITLIEADGRNDIDDLGYSENSDLFGVNDIYDNAKWFNNTNAGFTLKVNTIDESKANITITF